MNTVLKRLAAILTAAVMTITQLPATAFAEDILQSAQEAVTAEEEIETVPTEEENVTDPTEGENEAVPAEEENGTDPTEGENEVVLGEEENETDPAEEENQAVPMADEAVPAENGYDLWVNGEQFLPEKTTISCGGGSASLYIKDGEYTLALNNATITKAYDRGAINAGAEIDSLNIELNGSSTILFDKDEVGFGIYASCHLTIWGSGSLEINGSNEEGGNTGGICTMNGYDLTINGGTIVANGGDRNISYSMSNGISVGGVYSQNGGAVTARGGKGSFTAHGLRCSGGDVYVRGGTLILEAGEKTGWGEAAALSKLGSATLYFKESAVVKVGSDADHLNDYTGSWSYKYIFINAETVAEPYKLEIAGDYKKEYALGEELDMSGASFTVIMSDLTRQIVPFGDLTTDYNKNKKGVQYVTLTYGQGATAVSATIRVTVDGELNHVTDIRLMGRNGNYPVMAVDPATKQITGDFTFDPDVKEYHIAYYSDTGGIQMFVDHLGDCLL